MMSITWDAVLGRLAGHISEIMKSTVEVSDFVLPPKPELGDVALGCFRLAEAHGKNPAEIAEELAGALADFEGVAKAAAAGPYLNITFKLTEILPRLLKEAKENGDAFGQSDALGKQTILFEYANPNTHKEIHVGHLRNFILGASLVHLFRRAGSRVIPVSYINDVGTHVAKCLWLLVTKHGFDAKTFSSDDVDSLVDAVPLENHTAQYLGQVYGEATSAMEEDESVKDQVSFVHNALENHDPQWEALWQETRKWSMDELTEIFDELGVRIERQYFESECLDRSQEIVNQLEKDGIAKLSEGAVLIDMEEKKLGMMLLRKSDGSLLYAAKDLALAELKAQEYPEFTQSLVLVDERQSLAMRQLDEALKRIGYGKPYGYLGYELVTLPEGAMSSRKGNIITFQAFRDMVVEAAEAATRERHEKDWDEERISAAAKMLAAAGIKYAIVKQDPNKVIVFDIKKALSFEGDTGPYIQYAATRLGSILKKSGWSLGFQPELDFSGLQSDQERKLAVCIAQFADVVRRAALEAKPSLVARWCLALAQEVNAFYRDVPVLDAPPAIKDARLQLILLARHALVHGLDLLGIPTPEEM
ncbi:arginine--tRNA ligase [Patescibacteria group bacterium]|nr:arginine--tRNA ligase [Patescibacteria group bacterium]